MKSGPLVIASIVGAEPSIDRQIETAYGDGADAVELRADRIPIDALRLALESISSTFLRSDGATGACVLTIRDASEGGDWTGSDDDRAMLYQELVRPGVRWIDIEAAAWRRSEKLRGVPGAIQQSYARRGLAAPPPAVILSHHAVKPASASEMDDAIRGVAELPCEYAKLVFPTRDATDGIAIVQAMARSIRSSALTGGASALAILGTGPAAVMTRVLAGKFGGALVYAAVADGAPAAPGQPTLHQLRSVFSAGRVSEETRVFGVVGWPVEHSRSPQVHNAAMADAGIDGVYVPMPVLPDRASFEQFMRAAESFTGLGLTGLSVTAPHKEHALQWVLAAGGQCAAIARRCGAVNTLRRDDAGWWRADNTDVSAALDCLALAAGGPPEAALRGRSAVMLGAGGVARGIVAGLVEAGVAVTVTSRSAHRAAELAGEFGCVAADWQSRTSLQADILINGTPLGQSPRSDETPMPSEALSRYRIVFDTVYFPNPTRLLREAEQVGCLPVTGREMFLEQARRQFERWHGRRPSLAAMREAFDAA